MNKAGRQREKEMGREREREREGMYAKIILMQPLSVLSSDSRNRRRTEIGSSREKSQKEREGERAGEQTVSKCRQAT